MEFLKTMEEVALEIEAQFNEYDERKAVMVVLLPGSRYQTVMANLKHHDQYDKEVIQMTTKVCDTNQFINYVDILSKNAGFVHAKFVIVDDFLKVEASMFEESATKEILKEMLLEVAELGDEWELKITGDDVH